VRNLSEEFLPEHLAYLKSFFRRRPMNWLFPLSVTGGTVLAGLLVVRALHPGLSDGEVAGLMLVAAFLALAIVEHWMMVLPIDTTRLWRWAMRARTRRGGQEALWRSPLPAPPAALVAPPLREPVREQP
jgi:putative photosynthetic complex assembly protein 2